MTEYLLIKIKDEDFFKGLAKPDEFDAELNKALGEEAQLHSILHWVEGDGAKGVYNYLAKVEDSGIRPKIMGIRGVDAVISFAAEPLTEQV